MKKTYDRKVFKRKLLSDRRTVTVTIRLFMILLLGFPLLTRAGTVDSTRVANREGKSGGREEATDTRSLGTFGGNVDGNGHGRGREIQVVDPG